MAYERIRVEPLAAAIGAEISGVDLSNALDDPTAKEIDEAWMEHLVIFFRDQDISIDQHKAFARNFGELHVHTVLQPLKDEGHPEIVVLRSGAGHGTYQAEAWHSDVTFESKPPLGSILLARDVPDAGGDTMWSSMYAAYDALSDTMQRLLSDLRAVHTPGFFVQLADDDQREELPKEVTHPVIRTHPVTSRKGIFVNSAFTRRIDGMRSAESEALLTFLFRHLGSPEFTCRFRWRKNSIAMWDNRCTQHRVVADNKVDHRHMQRVTIVGDLPV